MNIISRLEFVNQTHPTKTALSFFLRRITLGGVNFQGLADSTQRFASGLLACGVTQNMRAALMTPPSADFFALAFALLKLGIGPIIIDPATD